MVNKAIVGDLKGPALRLGEVTQANGRQLEQPSCWASNTRPWPAITRPWASINTGTLNPDVSMLRAICRTGCWGMDPGIRWISRELGDRPNDYR